MRNLPLPEWMLEGSSFGEHGLELEYDSVVVRIANVRHQLSKLLNEKPSPQRTSDEFASLATELNHEARDIDKALQNWTAHFPSTWSYQRHTLSEPQALPTSDFYSPTVYSYSSPAYAAIWNQYYATRMLVNSTRWRVLHLPALSADGDADEQRLDCLFHINTMANDLASSVPYCLQRFTVAESPGPSSHRQAIMPNAGTDAKPYLAVMMIWPLTIASSLQGVGVEQRSWLRSELVRLGRIVGAGVFECAETDQWLEL
ncbi:hypothetical protein MMC11_000936 [Xylographa trunciseda]|nr:hypothetical protein [Xylographa trunciseda]